MSARDGPIIFSTEMVKAILDDRKIETRRVVRWPPGWAWPSEDEIDNLGDGESLYVRGKKITSPFGQGGDRLWVKETWAEVYEADDDGNVTVLPPTSIETREALRMILYRATDKVPENAALAWRSARFMPHRASRLALEVVEVSVERLQAIGAKDIIAEGAVARAHDDQFGHNPVSAFDGKVYLDLKSLWVAGWDQINAKRGFGWDANPWVWVVKFRRLP